MVNKDGKIGNDGPRERKITEEIHLYLEILCRLFVGDGENPNFDIWI